MANEANHEIIVISSDDETSKPQVSTKRSKDKYHSMTKKHIQYYNALPSKALKSVQPSNSNASKVARSCTKSSAFVTRNSYIESHKRTKRDSRINTQSSNKEIIKSNTKFDRSTLQENIPVTSISQHSSKSHSGTHSERYRNLKNSNGSQKMKQNQLSVSSITSNSKPKFVSNLTKASSDILSSNSKIELIQNKEKVSSLNTKASVFNGSGLKQKSKNASCSNKSSQNKNNSDKSVIPSSVINALQKKGISITNIITVSDSENNNDSHKPKTENQHFIEKIRCSLEGNGTSLKTVSQSKSILPSNRQIIQKNNNTYQKAICGKRKADALDVGNQSKLLCIRTSTVVSSSNVLTNTLCDLPSKTGLQISITSKPISSDSICSNKNEKDIQIISEIKSNTAVVKKTVQHPDISKVLSNKVMQTQKVTDTFKHLSSSITIIPVHDLTDSSTDNNDNLRKSCDSSHAQLKKPSMQRIARDKSKEVLIPKDIKNKVASSTVILPCNSSVSIKAINPVENLQLKSLESVTKSVKSQKTAQKLSQAQSKSFKEGNSSSTVTNLTCKKIDISKDRNALLNIIASNNHANIPKLNKETKCSKLITVPPKGTIFIPVGDKNKSEQKVHLFNNGSINKSLNTSHVSSVSVNVPGIISDKSTVEVTRVDPSGSSEGQNSSCIALKQYNLKKAVVLLERLILPEKVSYFTDRKSQEKSESNTEYSSALTNGGKTVNVSITANKCISSFILPNDTAISTYNKEASKIKSELKVDFTDSVKGPNMPVSPDESAAFTSLPPAIIKESTMNIYNEDSKCIKTTGILNDPTSDILIASVESVNLIDPAVDALVANVITESVAEKSAEVNDSFINVPTSQSIISFSNTTSPLKNAVRNTSDKLFDEKFKYNQVVNLDSVSSDKLLYNNKNNKLAKERIFKTCKRKISHEIQPVESQNPDDCIETALPKPVVLVEKIDSKVLSVYAKESVLEKENNLVKLIEENCCPPKIKKDDVSEFESSIFLQNSSSCMPVKPFNNKKPTTLLEKVFTSSDEGFLNQSTDIKSRETSETLLIADKALDFTSQKSQQKNSHNSLFSKEIFENVHGRSPQFQNIDLNNCISNTEDCVAKTQSCSENDISFKVDVSNNILDSLQDLKNLERTLLNCTTLAEGENNHSLKTEAVNCIEISDKSFQSYSVQLPGFQKSVGDSPVAENVIITPENSHTNCIMQSSSSAVSDDSMVITGLNSTDTNFMKSEIFKTQNNSLKITTMANIETHSENSQITFISPSNSSKLTDNSSVTKVLNAAETNPKSSKICPDKVIENADISQNTEMFQNSADQSQLLVESKAVSKLLNITKISSENVQNKTVQLAAASDTFDDFFSTKIHHNVNGKSGEIQKTVADLLNKVLCRVEINSGNSQNYTLNITEAFKVYDLSNTGVNNFDVNFENYQHQPVLSPEIYETVNDLLDFTVKSITNNNQNCSSFSSEICNDSKHTFNVKTLNNVEISGDNSVPSCEGNINTDKSFDSEVLITDKNINYVPFNHGSQNSHIYNIGEKLVIKNDDSKIISSVGTMNCKEISLVNSQNFHSSDICTTIVDNLNMQGINKKEKSETSKSCSTFKTLKNINSILNAEEYNMVVNPEDSQESQRDLSKMCSNNSDTLNDETINNLVISPQNSDAYVLQLSGDDVIEDSLNMVNNIEDNSKNSYENSVHSSKSCKVGHTALYNVEQNVELADICVTVTNSQNIEKVSNIEVSSKVSPSKSTFISDSNKNIDNSVNSEFIYKIKNCLEDASVCSLQMSKSGKCSVNGESINNKKSNLEDSSQVHLALTSNISKANNSYSHSEDFNSISYENSFVNHHEMCNTDISFITIPEGSNIDSHSKILISSSVCASEITDADLSNTETVKNQGNFEMTVIEDVLNNIISSLESESSVINTQSSYSESLILSEFSAHTSADKIFCNKQSINNLPLLDSPLLPKIMTNNTVEESKVNSNDAEKSFNTYEETSSKKMEGNLNFLSDTSEKPYDHNLFLQKILTEEGKKETEESLDNSEKFCTALGRISETGSEKDICCNVVPNQSNEKPSKAPITDDIYKTTLLDVTNSFDDSNSITFDRSAMNCNISDIISQMETGDSIQDSNETCGNKMSVEMNSFIEDFNSSSTSKDNLLSFNASDTQQKNICKNVEASKESNQFNVKSCIVEKCQSDVSGININLCKAEETTIVPMKEEVSSQKITSPKLSLKRSRMMTSPDSKLLDMQQNGYSSDNSCKKVRFSSPIAIDCVPSSIQGKHFLEKLSPVPSFTSSTEDFNRKMFLEIVEFSKTLMNETPVAEKEKIAKNLMQTLRSTDQSFVDSEKFTTLLQTSNIHLRKSKNEEVFNILSQLRTELKKFKKKKSTSKIESSDNTNILPLHSPSKSCSQEEGKNKLSPVFATSESLATKTSVTLSTGENTEKNSLHSYELCSKISEILKSSINENNAKLETCNLSNDATSLSVPPASENTNCLNKDDINKEKPLVVTSELSTTKINEPCNDKGFESSVDLPSKYSAVSKSTISLSSCTKNTEQKPDLESSILVSNSLNSKMDKSSIPNEWVIGGKKYSSFNAISPASKFSSNRETEKPKSDSASSSSSTFVNINKSSNYPSSNTKEAQGCDKSTFKNDPFFIKASTSVTEDKIKETISKLNVVSQKEKVAKETLDRNIQKLEKWLAKMDRRIKKLRAKELSLDDLENPDSAYVLEDKYIRNFNRAWKQLCKLKNQSSRTGRVIEKKLSCSGSRHSAINEAVRKMINKRKVEEKFPNYVEILDLVKKVNEMTDIGLSQRELEIEAETVFREVGKELQWRRNYDFEELFGCHLTDNFDPTQDPAEQDEELRKVLTDSYQKFEASVSKLIDQYAEKQVLNGTEVEENQKSISEEEEEDEEEENETKKLQEEADKLTDVASPLSGCSPNTNDKSEASSSDVMEIVYDSDKSTEPTANVDDININKIVENLSKNRKQKTDNESSVLPVHKNTKPQESSLNHLQDEDSSDMYPHKEKGECSFKITYTEVKEVESSSDIQIHKPKNSEPIIDDSDSSLELPPIDEIFKER